MNRKTSKRKLLTFTSRAVVVILAFLVLALSPNLLLTQEGDLDLSFGEGGKVTTNFIGPNSDQAMDLVVNQSDGKIVVVGDTQGDFALARYNMDGSLDTSFGDEGHVTTDFDDYSRDRAYSVALQADGKIVVVGESIRSGYRRFALARYNADGSLDTGFGESGLVLTDFGPAVHSSARAVAVQNDGKIVIVGYSGLGTKRFALARYNVDGSLDSGFGEGGLVITPFPGHLGIGSAAAVTIQSDGKIVAVGSSWIYEFALARYNPDGTLDLDFGTNGLVTTRFPDSQYNSATGVAVQNDGKIVAAGQSYSNQWPQRQDFALARYNPDGSLDSGFGSSGLVTIDIDEADDYLMDLAIQADQKLVVAGYANHLGVPRSFALVRFNTDGSLDTSFGDSGKVNSVQGEAFSLAVHDGKIIAAGHSYLSDTGKNFVLARYNPDGSLDTSFGTGGLVFDDFLGPNFDMGKDIVAVQGDGKIVVVGTTHSGGGGSFALARYNRDGSLDASFGEGGVVTSDFANSNEVANGVAVQDDGKIVVAGWTIGTNTTGPDFALARYNTDGSLDISFGVDGLVTTDWSSNQDYANAVAIQADGKIVAAGYARVSGNWVIALARYNPDDGSLDAFFGTDGLVTLGILSWDEANAIAIQTDGKIVIAGGTYTGNYFTGRDFVVARFLTGGSLDLSFGAGGYVTTGFGTPWDRAYGVAIQTDGKIVAVGDARTLSPWREIAMARYNTDGSLDPSFGIGGLVTTDFDFRTASAYDVAIQDDGKIVVGGEADGGQPWGRDFILARFNTTGSPDPDFGIGGYVTTDFSNTTDIGFGVDIQADGKIVLAGYTNSGSPTSYDFALARYIAIKSPNKPIEDLIIAVQALVPEPLNNGQANSLQAKLRATLHQLNKDNVASATNQLSAFINEVSAFISGGVLTSEEGLPLISAVQAIIDSLQSP
jgi:uncharacterized delta-60 repeat protein